MPNTVGCSMMDVRTVRYVILRISNAGLRTSASRYELFLKIDPGVAGKEFFSCPNPCIRRQTLTGRRQMLNCFRDCPRYVRVDPRSTIF